MEKYSKTIQLRWSDVDQNRHLRHSVYYDFGAFIRISFLTEHGLTTSKMEELKIGPILFREEIIFKREIKPEDQLEVDVELVKTTPGYAKWSLRHRFIKGDGTIAAVLTTDGAWMDIEQRKLVKPDAFVQKIFDDFPKAEEFEITEKLVG